MRYVTIKLLQDDDFRRLTGVHRVSFDKMADFLREAKTLQKAKGGKPNSLCIEDELLMMLGYWREYRTYFHIGQTYGLCESQAYRIIRWCEDTLKNSELFKLPGRKAVCASERSFDVVIIDATETPIERPKKSNAAITQAKRNGTR
jgi:hypothetical protein